MNPKTGQTGVTALEQYARLEATGLWREGEEAQRREVIVSFGKATLVLSDLNETPLAHWSLAAVDRIGRGLPATYAIGEDTTETLEIEDSVMVDAIEKIRRPLRPSAPTSGTLRLGLFSISLVLAALAIWVWLPPALANYTARVIPQSKAIEIGNNLMGHIERFTGQECRSLEGDTALAKLHARILPDDDGRLRVADLGGQTALHLPGGFTVLHIAIIEEFSGPAVTAGYILKEATNRDGADPIADFFQSSGLGATISFLTSGEISEEDYRSYARAKVTDIQDIPQAEDLLRRFEAVSVPSTPFAYALDPSGNSTKLLIDLDPVKTSYPQILEDSDWLALQAICD
ncbi:MAG: hypothetical protein AAF826_04385 [Pseudomonadota bacterium]